ncbi:MAG TPA: hypothetical protein VIN03_07735 [Roseateles sp.]
MARSSLLGVDPAAPEPAGRDKASLGPSDSSDSGSDVTGLESNDDDADPGLPVDVALRDDQVAPLPLGESLPASEGEAGVRDGADIGVDRVFTTGDAGEAEALLEAIDEAPVEDEDEDEEDDNEEEAEGELPGDADPDSSHTPGRS